jgi:hypothetical protein
MQYTERYVIRWKKRHGLTGETEEGQFGPYDVESDAMSMMLKIQKRHNHVKDIFWAEMFRVSEVMLAGHYRASP